MKKILLITTGGTIASSDRGNGLVPALNVEELLSYIPEVRTICDLEGVAVMSIDSTNMTPERMLKIAEAIGRYYNAYDGFVIAHGTDTMAYSAAALTYMLRNLGKPVVLTGSQIAMESPDTDAKKNLSDAIRVACEDFAGVVVVFHGLVISGTHARKQKTRSKDGFASINAPNVAAIEAGNIMFHPAWKGIFRQGATQIGAGADKTEDDNMKAANSESLEIPKSLCKDIALFKVFPGMDPEILDFAGSKYKGVILESFGIGGIPGEENNLVEKIEGLLKRNIAVVITTQCPYEGVDLSIYGVGKKLDSGRVILGGTMTTEALTMKLMCTLGQEEDPLKVKQEMETSVMGDREVFL